MCVMQKTLIQVQNRRSLRFARTTAKRILQPLNFFDQKAGHGKYRQWPPGVTLWSHFCRAANPKLPCCHILQHQRGVLQNAGLGNHSLGTFEDTGAVG
jgi:hypothetical protein